MTDSLIVALAERDRILVALDVDAAKRFISTHGGFISDRPRDWLRVLHLARLEVTTMPESLHWESRIYLARTGAQSVGTLPEKSPYLVALDLIFPKTLFEAFVAEEVVT